MKWMSAALLLGIVVLSGCSNQDGLVRRLENPTQLHGDDDFPQLQDLPKDRKPVVSAIPVDVYLKAMKAAYRRPADQQRLRAYVDAGVALSDAYCTRWFRRLDDAQRRITFAQNNFNVVRQLGTALIGVAGLSSDTTTVYGALNTAIEGVNANINEALFLAPDTALIKRRVTEAMADRAHQLKSSNRPTNFADAYVQLERYADMCTFVSARQYVNQAITAPSGAATADPVTGEITLAQGAATSFSRRWTSCRTAAPSRWPGIHR
jgi:hypothetical protein